MIADITKEQFLNASIENISQVYMGKQHCCRCGCGGDYTSTSFMKDARSDVNDSLVARRLNRAQKLVMAGAEVEFGNTFVDVTTGANRTLTFYFDELK